jgi:hypothetical protein
MRSLFITAALVMAAIELAGCPGPPPDKSKPVPTPQTALQGMAVSAGMRARHGASQIAWFQGTLEEAFAPSHRAGGCPLLHY